MIRIATFDRHPTVHAGVEAIVGAQPDLLHVGSAADRSELMRLLARARPDVVVLAHRPGRDGFELCLRITARQHGPRVLVFGAGMDAEAIVPATLAGAAAIVDKSAPAPTLLEAIRAVAAGEHLLEPVTLQLQSRAARRLGMRDRAIFAMRLAGTTSADIAAVLRLPHRAVRGRLAAIVATLDGHPRVPAQGRPPMIDRRRERILAA
jgi:DNA-binding NarL/FixJ family response regulator